MFLGEPIWIRTCDAALFHDNATTINDTLHLLILLFGRNACFGMEIRNGPRELPGRLGVFEYQKKFFATRHGSNLNPYAACSNPRCHASSRATGSEPSRTTPSDAAGSFASYFSAPKSCSSDNMLRQIGVGLGNEQHRAVLQELQDFQRATC